jgi:hypothetical protein
MRILSAAVMKTLIAILGNKKTMDDPAMRISAGFLLTAGFENSYLR